MHFWGREKLIPGKIPACTESPTYDNFWTAVMCVAGDGALCSGLFACNSVKSCACIQVIPPAQAFDMKNAFYWDYFYNVSDLRVHAAIKSGVIKAFRDARVCVCVCAQNANSINFTFMLSSGRGLSPDLQSIFALFNSISQFRG